jgi:hypothetical protein
MESIDINMLLLSFLKEKDQKLGYQRRKRMSEKVPKGMEEGEVGRDD